MKQGKWYVYNRTTTGLQLIDKLNDWMIVWCIADTVCDRLTAAFKRCTHISKDYEKPETFTWYNLYVLSTNTIQWLVNINRVWIQSLTVTLTNPRKYCYLYVLHSKEVNQDKTNCCRERDANSCECPKERKQNVTLAHLLWTFSQCLSQLGSHFVEFSVRFFGRR